jgi:hypothetical protein
VNGFEPISLGPWFPLVWHFKHPCRSFLFWAYFLKNRPKTETSQIYALKCCSGRVSLELPERAFNEKGNPIPGSLLWKDCFPVLGPFFLKQA